MGYGDRRDGVDGRLKRTDQHESKETSMALTVVAKLKAKAGSEKELEAALRAMMPKVREEPGALTYILTQSVKDPTVFVFYEVYKDQAAFDFHTKTPHMAELQSKLPALLDGRPTVDLLNELDGKR